ncbi:hypothetical protein V2G26_016544 [Clonostachys chloroleuca]
MLPNPEDYEESNRLSEIHAGRLIVGQLERHGLLISQLRDSLDEHPVAKTLHECEQPDPEPNTSTSANHQLSGCIQNGQVTALVQITSSTRRCFVFHGNFTPRP